MPKVEIAETLIDVTNALFASNQKGKIVGVCFITWVELPGDSTIDIGHLSCFDHLPASTLGKGLDEVHRHVVGHADCKGDDDV